ncbi:MAG: SIMPL domain-containing protein [Saprospiraceae bacterium]|nr:SIMPL domain-containing protein [Pyrinomonadaceae bacterium]
MNSNTLQIVALAAFLALLGAAIYLYRPQQEKLTRITVVGDSLAKVAPDTAVITFSVVTQGKQAVDAQQENARKSEAVKKAVEAVSGDSKTEIQTSGYSLNPEQDYYSGKMPKILGYEVKNTVTVSIDKLDRVGTIIDAATNAGANSVDGIQFVVGETSPAQGDGLALATKQAMAKAESVAKSLNGKIVRVVQTSEGSVPPQFIGDSYASNSNAMSSVDRKPTFTTPVQAGSLNVRSQVILVVDISI